MLATITVSLAIVLLCCGGLALGQFFGRKPITPKCNPDSCCMQGENCERRSAPASRRT